MFWLIILIWKRGSVKYGGGMTTVMRKEDYILAGMHTMMAMMKSLFPQKYWKNINVRFHHMASIHYFDIANVVHFKGIIFFILLLQSECHHKKNKNQNQSLSMQYRDPTIWKRGNTSIKIRVPHQESHPLIYSTRVK